MNWEDFVKSLTELEKPLVKAYLDILNQTKPNEVLEIGSGWGIFARSLFQARPDAKLVTIDKIPIVGRQDFNKNTSGFEDQIERVIMESKGILPIFLSEKREFDFIFVDGAHDYVNCLSDLSLSFNLLRIGGMMMIDDVFHEHNWTGDYGVGHALWDFMGERFNDGEEFKIVKVGSGGVALLRKL